MLKYNTVGPVVRVVWLDACEPYPEDDTQVISHDIFKLQCLYASPLPYPLLGIILCWRNSNLAGESVMLMHCVTLIHLRAVIFGLIDVKILKSTYKISIV